MERWTFNATMWGMSVFAMGSLGYDLKHPVLEDWPEPDYDDPGPEVYAAREQIEEWVRCTADARKTLVVVWA